MRRHYPSDGGRMKSGRELWLCYKEEEEEEGEEEMKKRGKEEREREKRNIEVEMLARHVVTKQWSNLLQGTTT